MRKREKFILAAGASIIPIFAAAGSVSAYNYISEKVNLSQSQIEVIDKANATYRQTLTDAGISLSEARQYRRQSMQDQRTQNLADFLGMSKAEVEAALESGKSPTELVKEKGKSLDAWYDFSQQKRKEHIEELVKSGEITQEEADKMLAGEGGPKGGRHRGPGMQ